LCKLHLRGFYLIIFNFSQLFALTFANVSILIFLQKIQFFLKNFHLLSNIYNDIVMNSFKIFSKFKVMLNLSFFIIFPFCFKHLLESLLDVERFYLYLSIYHFCFKKFSSGGNSSGTCLAIFFLDIWHNHFVPIFPIFQELHIGNQIFCSYFGHIRRFINRIIFNLLKRPHHQLIFSCSTNTRIIVSVSIWIVCKFLVDS
jgi:hypothetical protein